MILNYWGEASAHLAEATKKARKKEALHSAAEDLLELVIFFKEQFEGIREEYIECATPEETGELKDDESLQAMDFVLEKATNAVKKARGES